MKEISVGDIRKLLFECDLGLGFDGIISAKKNKQLTAQSMLDLFLHSKDRVLIPIKVCTNTVKE
jgi:hypothetical protein